MKIKSNKHSIVESFEPSAGKYRNMTATHNRIAEN